MARSDDIARLIPLYRQFIATQRALAQQQVAKLRRQPAAAEPPAADVAAAAGADPDTAAASTKEVPIETN